MTLRDFPGMLSDLIIAERLNIRLRKINFQEQALHLKLFLGEQL